MVTIPLSLDRLLAAGFLASLAVFIAFGPELGRAIARLRGRRISDAPDALISKAQ